MNVLWILLTVLLGLLLLVFLLIVFGKATIRIVCRKKLRVTLTVAGVPITLVSDKEKKKRDLKVCKNPERALKKERKRAAKAAKKATRKQQKSAKRTAKRKKKQALAAQKAPKNNLPENISFVIALLRELYRKTNGNLTLRVRKLHLYVATGDAATTACVYGAVMQLAAFLFQWIENNFTHIQRKEGAMEVISDFTAQKPYADIDIACTVGFRQGIGIGIAMLQAYKREKRNAVKKAKARLQKQDQARADQ